jgi:hypothetical protein
VLGAGGRLVLTGWEATGAPGERVGARIRAMRRVLATATAP